MSAWRTVPLEDLAADEPNSFVDGPFGSDLKTSEYVEVGVPLIRIQNVKPNRFLSKEIRYVSDQKARQLSRHNYRPGDLVITKLGAPCGVACIVPEQAGCGLIVADIVRFRGDSRKIDHGFLSHFINSPAAIGWVGRETKGTTRQRVNLSNFKRLPVPLPPLPEQRRIAEVLDRAEALRAKRRTALAQFDTLTQSIFLDLFGDPVTNNKGFPVSQMGDVCDVRDGTHDSPKYVSDGGYPLVTSKNVSGGFVDLTDANYISEADYVQINKRSKVDRGDIIMPMIGTIGSPVLADHEPRYAIKNVALIKFTETSPSAVFVRHLLSCHYFDHIVSQKNRGGTQKFVSLGDLRAFPLPLPPMELQGEFTRCVHAVEKLRATYRASLAELDALFASLQHRAFRGEL